MEHCGSLEGNTVDGVLWEAGHYYESKGPTLWSEVSWRIAQELREERDCTMIMVDDVHEIDLVHPSERALERVDFVPNPAPCHIVRESAMADPGFGVLEMLKQKQLPRRKRARLAFTPKRWSCSGFALTTPNGGAGPHQPLCLLYDLGLTWHKYGLGLRRIVNVLPEFYAPEQAALIRIARKVMPDLDIRAVLFNLDGERRWLRLSDILR